MAFTLIWSEKARKQLEKLESNIAKRIIEKTVFANQNGLIFLEKVHGQDFCKYRVGKFRLFVKKIPEQNVLLITTVKPRKNAYKNL